MQSDQTYLKVSQLNVYVQGEWDQRSRPEGQWNCRYLISKVIFNRGPCAELNKVKRLAMQRRKLQRKLEMPVSV